MKHALYYIKTYGFKCWLKLAAMKILSEDYRIERKVSKCHRYKCDGTMKRTTFPHTCPGLRVGTIDPTWYPIHIDRHPGWQCDKCGEKLFETEDTAVIYEVLTNVLKYQRGELVPLKEYPKDN